MMLRVLVIVASLSIAYGSHAMAPREIGWDDLIPPMEPLIDPFEDMNALARDDLYLVQEIERIKSSQSVSPETERLLREARENLTKAGVDIEASLRVLQEFEAEITSRDEKVVDEFVSEIIKMPGYALPLELSEEGVREFLLVPYVGACIHTPPPPANQMVMVELSEPYRLKSIYDAIWITGEISVEKSTQHLSFVDGSANVSVGYRLKGLLIEPYEW